MCAHGFGDFEVRAGLGHGGVGAQGDGERVVDDVEVDFFGARGGGFEQCEGFFVAGGVEVAIDGFGGGCGAHDEADCEECEHEAGGGEDAEDAGGSKGWSGWRSGGGVGRRERSRGRGLGASLKFTCS